MVTESVGPAPHAEAKGMPCFPRRGLFFRFCECCCHRQQPSAAGTPATEAEPCAVSGRAGGADLRAACGREAGEHQEARRHLPCAAGCYPRWLPVETRPEPCISRVGWRSHGARRPTRTTELGRMIRGRLDS